MPEPPELGSTLHWSQGLRDTIQLGPQAMPNVKCAIDDQLQALTGAFKHDHCAETTGISQSLTRKAAYQVQPQIHQKIHLEHFCTLRQHSSLPLWCSQLTNSPNYSPSQFAQEPLAQSTGRKAWSLCG